jgi:hypothetical protein
MRGFLFMEEDCWLWLTRVIGIQVNAGLVSET